MPRDLDDLGIEEPDLARVATLLRQVTSDDAVRHEPPADLRQRIAAAAEPADRADEGATVVALHSRRRARILAVAAAVVLVALVAGLVVARAGSQGGSEVVARTELRPLDGQAGPTADVQVVRRGTDLRLELVAADMPAAPAGSFYELWLMDGSITTPVLLGSMDGSITVPIPQGVDPAQFPVVDVSLQPSGQDAYSGHSLLRGTLT